MVDRRVMLLRVSIKHSMLAAVVVGIGIAFNSRRKTCHSRVQTCFNSALMVLVANRLVQEQAWLAFFDLVPYLSLLETNVKSNWT